MTRDAIIEEVRALRDAIAKEHDYDIDAIFDALRKMEAASGREHISLAPRRTPQPGAAPDAAEPARLNAHSLGRQLFCMKTDYDCLGCKHRFAIEVTESESRSVLDGSRTDACPKCAQRVGAGPVHCRGCGGAFTLAFPHWHVHCDLAGGDCPACGVRYVSLCIC